MTLDEGRAARQAEDFFGFTREMMRGDIYRKYEKAIRLIWNPHDLDYSRDAVDWNQFSEEQRQSILTITVRLFSGEQRVAEVLVPAMEAARLLRRFDWLMYLSTFMMEEVKHADFFALWHEQVVGILEPHEMAPYFVFADEATPVSRYQIKEIGHEGLQKYSEALMQAVNAGDHEQIKPSLVRFLTLYNALAEGVISMPAYSMIVDACMQWGALPALEQGFRSILVDEGRHITFGTTAVGLLIKENPAYEPLVYEVFNDFRGNIVGRAAYQTPIEGLDMSKYHESKAKHYRNRCREMGITADQTLIDQILGGTSF